MVDWIYKYVGRNETCNVVGEYDKMSTNIMELRLNIPQTSTFESNTDESFSDIEIFGLVFIAFISMFAFFVVIGFVWKKTYMRINSHME